MRTWLMAAALGAVATAAMGDMTMKGSLQAAPEREWTYVADTVMGGVSRGQSSVGSDKGQTFIRLTGVVSTENRGGFIQVRTKTDALDNDVQGLLLKVRGNGERYFIHLRTTSTRLPWQYYQASFDTGPEWREVRLPWAAFKPSGGLLPGRISPEKVRSVGLVAYGRDHVADVSLAEIGLY